MPISIHSQIIARITQMGTGTTMFPTDFMELGDHDSIRKSLSNLVKQDFLVRLAHGIYLYPTHDKELGVLYPSIDAIVEAISRRDKIRTIPTGVQALHKLGLSTQVPMNIVYLTDGTARKIKFGKRSITFKKTNPKKLQIKNNISGLVIHALSELGKENITDEITRKITDVLKNEKKDVILADMKLAPAWIRKIMMLILKESYE